MTPIPDIYKPLTIFDLDFRETLWEMQFSSDHAAYTGY
jgi:hypothetical protein